MVIRSYFTFLGKKIIQVNSKVNNCYVELDFWSIISGNYGEKLIISISNLKTVFKIDNNMYLLISMFQSAEDGA